MHAVASVQGAPRRVSPRPWRGSFVVAALATSLAVSAAGCGTSAAGGTHGHNNQPGTASRPATGGSHPGSSSTTTTTQPGLTQPTAAQPLTVLSIGDSLGEDLGLGLADVLGSNPLARVVQDAKGDSGLARPDFFDWPAALATDLRQTHPQVVVVLFGANDAQAFTANGQVVLFGSPQWHTIYSQRVALMMDEVLKAGARLIWVGIPIMGPNASVTNTDMQMLNSIYQTQAAAHPSVVWFPSWSLFSDSAGNYTEYVTDAAGNQVLARGPDQVHLATGGFDYLANAVTSQIEKTWHVSFAPPASTTTTAAG